jgi:hypothetical protein
MVLPSRSRHRAESAFASGGTRCEGLQSSTGSLESYRLVARLCSPSRISTRVYRGAHLRGGRRAEGLTAAAAGEAAWFGGAKRDAEPGCERSERRVLADARSVSARTMDIDNIPKPISDALKGLVYLDDEQVTDVLCRKRDLNSNLRIESPSSVLADGLSRGNEFLYIVVEEAPDQEVIS